MAIDDVIWSEEEQVLVSSADLEAPLYEAMAEWLTREWSSQERDHQVADVGCGAGGMTSALASRVEGGRIDAVDREPALLDVAWRRISEAKLGECVRLLIGDIERLTLPEASYDLVWAGSVIHHLPDQHAGIRRLARLLSPGGRLALGEGGLGLRCLPYDLGIGRPGLEERLASAQAEWFDALRAGMPGGVRAPGGWNTLLAQAGLVDPAKRSFLFEMSPPLPDVAVAYLIAHFQSLRRRPGLWSRLDPDDAAVMRRLLDPDDGAFLGRRDDTFLLTARSVHVARRPLSDP